MSEHSTSTPFIKASSQDQYGKIPLKSWTGKIVSFDSQKDQIESGWGWRYKVRVMGDNSDNDTVDDGDLSYAFVLLPTTAGSGGAFKLRSVRISQGDMVYGVYGGDGPRLILGVFPRTTKTGLSGGKFGTLSGFYGSLQNTGIISGEFNEQIGPQTPGIPKPINKSNRAISQREIESIGVDPNNDKIETNMNEKLKPKTISEDQPWEPGESGESGDPINLQQLKFILKQPLGTYEEGYIPLAINQAVIQNLISKDTQTKLIKLVSEGSDKMIELLETGITPINEVI